MREGDCFYPRSFGWFVTLHYPDDCFRREETEMQQAPALSCMQAEVVRLHFQSEGGERAADGGRSVGAGRGRAAEAGWPEERREGQGRVGQGREGDASGVERNG